MKLKKKIIKYFLPILLTMLLLLTFMQPTHPPQTLTRHLAYFPVNLNQTPYFIVVPIDNGFNLV